jgi:F0F1-type ATP synthase assembly protein I
MTEESKSSQRPPKGLVQGEGIAWSVMSTLVAGPVLYGFIGWGVDALVGTTRVFTALGVLIGFVLSFFIVYARHGRS